MGSPRIPESDTRSWVGASCFLLAWTIPATLSLLLKWYALTDLHGFGEVARSVGESSLSLIQRLSFFRADVLVAFLLIPAGLLIVNRLLPTRWAAAFTATVSVGFLCLLGAQLWAMDQIGRYISFGMMWIALSWGWHEPAANAGYLPVKGLIAFAVCLVGIGAAIAWSVKKSRSAPTTRAAHVTRITAEAYLLAAVVVLAAGWKSNLPKTPFDQSSAVRAVVSLWKAGAVDTGEFAQFDFDHGKQLVAASWPPMKTAQLVSRYRNFVHAPAPDRDPRYFGKERGDNVLFFILETTPAEFLPPDGSMKRFPNLGRLREKSFVGTEHVTTLPMTVTALFSVFSSWYPMDSLKGAWAFPPDDVAPDFLPRLEEAGYETAAFTPLQPSADEQDRPMYRALGFQEAFAPSQGLGAYDGEPSWQQKRVAADLATLHILEAHMTQWMDSDQKFVAAFMPQISHFPYPDSYPPSSTADIRARARAILAKEDSWLGDLMDLLQKHGELDKTIIVVVGDHGTRDRLENPHLRRGTIDKTSFHVPLFIYAPNAVQKTVWVPWTTSHIDIVPTVMDLLGVQGGRESEQGTEIWNPQLAGRTTFLFAGPNFGADGYVSDQKYYMLNYFSDSVYENSQASFRLINVVPRWSPAEDMVKSKLSTVLAMEKAWQLHFARPRVAGPPNLTAMAHR